jgi:hypothetical protein
MRRSHVTRRNRQTDAPTASLTSSDFTWVPAAALAPPPPTPAAADGAALSPAPASTIANTERVRKEYSHTQWPAITAMPSDTVHEHAHETLTSSTGAAGRSTNDHHNDAAAACACACAGGGAGGGRSGRARARGRSRSSTSSGSSGSSGSSTGGRRRIRRDTHAGTVVPENRVAQTAASRMMQQRL